jgi:cytochrome P450
MAPISQEDFDRVFDRVMTVMKPLLVRLAALELRGSRRTQVKHTIISAYLQARINDDGLSLEKAIGEACDYFAPISERTVATAWKQSRAYLNRKAARRRKELEENPHVGNRAIADLVKRERTKRTAKK